MKPSAPPTAHGSQAQSRSAAAVVDGIYSFGPFRLIPSQRILFKGEEPVHLGGRAFSILLALVDRPGVVMSNQDLMRAAWSNVVVEEANLRVQIRALRKALSTGEGDRPFIDTVPLQGYCFVQPVSRLEKVSAVQPRNALVTPELAHNLPEELVPSVGREDTVEALLIAIRERRLVTICGAGGIGKTTVALAVARRALASFKDGVWHVDFSVVSDPKLIHSSVASVLGLCVLSEASSTGLVTYLRPKRLMLLLDTCEHVIEPLATFVEEVLSRCPQIQIVATSREALRASGEWTHRLTPLSAPPPGVKLSPVELIRYPAVELFVQRVSASMDHFEIRAPDVELVSSICRRLDGMPLAIEFAAARVEELGLRQVAEGLDDRFSVLNRGRRTALPRHRTLFAALQWSYELLPPDEQRLIRALSSFRGGFLASASPAVFGEGEDRNVQCLLSNLLAKSLVSATIGNDRVLYRLLDTTRAFALRKLVEAHELPDTLRRHATFVLASVVLAEVDWERMEASEWVRKWRYLLDDVRAALDWASSSEGDPRIQLALSTGSSVFWHALSLLDECAKYAHAALAANAKADKPDHAMESRLWDMIGHATWHAQGDLPLMRQAFRRALTLSEGGSVELRLRALWGLLVCANSMGEYEESLAYLADYRTASSQVVSERTELTYQRMAALGLHYAGQHKKAELHALYVLEHPTSRETCARQSGMQFDQRISARSVLARVLYFKGQPAQALECALTALQLAQNLGHALSECFVLANAVTPIAFWTGRMDIVATMLPTLLTRTREHSFAMWHTFGLAYQAVWQADQVAFNDLKINGKVGGHLLETVASIDSNFADEVLLDRAESERWGWCTPELLRIRATQLIEAGQPRAEPLLVRALELARSQDSAAWVLRVSTSLAGLLASTSRGVEAKALLEEALGHWPVDDEAGGFRPTAVDLFSRL